LPNSTPMPKSQAKSAASKRTSLPLPFEYAKSFLKDWERLSHSGRYDMNRLKETMHLLIANTGMLPAEYKNHPLVGDWVGFDECHVGGDFLMIYERRADGWLVFTRAGTHSDLFGK
jgi:mRNA interferase YafQ